MNIKDKLTKLTDDINDQNRLSEDRQFSQDQTTRVIQALAEAAQFIIGNLDQSKDVAVTNKVLEVDSPKFDVFINGIKEVADVGRANAPLDQQPLIEAMDRATKAIESLPEPPEIKIPEPVDYNPSFRHLASQLEKLNKKDFSPTLSPEITVSPAPVSVDVDLSELVRSQREMSDKLDRVIDYLIKTPQFPVDDMMFLFKDMQESLDIMARRPQVIAPGGTGGGGGSSTPTTSVYDTATYGSGTYS